MRLNPGENFVCKADGGLLSGNEAADVSQEGNQGDLLQVDTLARVVRACEKEHPFVLGSSQLDVVWNKGVNTELLERVSTTDPEKEKKVVGQHDSEPKHEQKKVVYLPSLTEITPSSVRFGRT